MSLYQESSVWVLEEIKSKSFEYVVNIDSPPLSVFFPTPSLKILSDPEYHRMGEQREMV